jgi:hypothetical protein
MPCQRVWSNSASVGDEECGEACRWDSVASSKIRATTYCVPGKLGFRVLGMEESTSDIFPPDLHSPNLNLNKIQRLEIKSQVFTYCNVFSSSFISSLSCLRYLML